MTQKKIVSQGQEDAGTKASNFASGVNTFDTRIGRLEFKNGYPTEQTASTLYDEMDFQRAVQVYLWSLPFVSMQAFHEECQKTDGSMYSPAIFEDRVPPSTIVLTGNKTTLYTVHTFVLDEDEPVVLEIPGQNVLGMIDNAWQQPLSDLGLPGPDKGEGGKYLLLPPEYSREVPSGYFAVHSDSYQVYYLLRAFDPGQQGVDQLKSIKLYRLSEKDNPPEMRPYNASSLGMDFTYPIEEGYFEMLARGFRDEYLREEDKNMIGIMAELGMKPGQPFEPDARLKKILAQAAKVGNAMAVNLSFNSRYAEAKVWPDRNYVYVFLGGEPSFETADRHMIDARVNFAHQAFSTAQSMTLELVGAGSKYFAGVKDGSGAWLNGSNTYRIRVSKDVPARNFWSLMVYDTGTRSMIDTEQGIPGLGGGDDLKRNEDDTVDLYMSPSAPAGMESNWVQTIPDQGFFIYFRLYGPEEAFFNGTWKLNDIELVKKG